MFDNKNFESQVQQKLQELDISPSASVWDRIEAQLPPENRRRRGIIWWSAMMVAAVAAGGFFFLNNTTIPYKVNNSTLPVNAPVIVSGNQLSAGSKKISGKGNIDSGTITNDNVIYSSPEDKAIPEKYSGIKNRLSGKHTATRNLDKRQGSAKENNYPAGGGLPSENRLPGAGGVSTPEDKRGGPLRQQAHVPAVLMQKDPVVQTAPADRPETIIRPASVESVKYNTSFYVDATIKALDAPVASKQVHLKNKKRWTFELSASGGQSTYNSGTVDKLFTSANSPVLNANRLFFASGNLLYAVAPAPSGVKPGLGFSLGLNARYHINRRLSVVTGLNYSLLSTRINTGQRSGNKTTVTVNGRTREINEFYASGSSYDHSNNYHFVEIPLIAHFQLNRGRVLPLSIQGGLSYACLLKTSSLQYDGQSNIYYKADELVRKDFLNVEAGIAAKLFSARKYPVTIGPRIQYGLTNLFNENLPQSSKHSLFIGVKASVPLHF